MMRRFVGAARMARAATFVAIAAMLLTASACDRSAPAPAAVASDSVAPSASGAETFFRYGLLVTARTRKDLQASLGAPDSVVAKAVKNRHDESQTDSLIVVHYPALAAEIYRVSANGNELLSWIRVSDNRYINATAPVRVGMSAADLSSMMGSPADTAMSTYTYACATCTELGNDRVGVSLAGNRVTAVTIFYSID